MLTFVFFNNVAGIYKKTILGAKDNKYFEHSRGN